MSDLPIARKQRADAERTDSGFFYQKFGPETLEISAGWEMGPPGVSWSGQVEPDDEGLYRVSLSIRKISGDVRNTILFAGTPARVWRSSGSHVSGIVYYDPDNELTPWIAIQASMNLGGSAAVIEASGFICSWT